MGVNESGLKRTVKKDGELQKKLVEVRKKRDNVADKIQRVFKKKNKTRIDLQRVSQYNESLIKYEKEITKLVEDIRKNTSSMEIYKVKVNKEQSKQFQSLTKSLVKQKNDNQNYINRHTELSNELEELSRDIQQSVKQKEHLEFDVFLSHSSFDKEEYVSELSDKLESKELKVFEDVKVFKIGQSQTNMMNMGILNSRFVVVFLSLNFINSGWSDYEFKSFLNREINEKKIIILPIWHNVSFEDVKNYNPYLVDKFALDTRKYSLDEIVESIYQAVRGSLEEN